MSTFPYKRVVVVGVTSSGKSTLAETLAKRFELDFIELDALNWEPNWQAAPLEVFRARVEKAMQVEKWIVAGNYHMVRDLIWPKVLRFCAYKTRALISDKRNNKSPAPIKSM